MTENTADPTPPEKESWPEQGPNIKPNKSSEERVEALFQANPNPEAILDLADDAIVDANPAFLEYMGKERDQVIGHHAAEHGGHGLTMPRQRLGLFGRFMDIESAPEAGARVLISVPLSAGNVENEPGENA
jgi:PAS domain-containing protein